LDAAVLTQAVVTTCPHGKTASILLRAIGLGEDAAQHALDSVKSPPTKDPIPEIEIYLGILIQVRGSSSLT
jgi:hypothetical protein